MGSLSRGMSYQDLPSLRTGRGNLAPTIRSVERFLWELYRGHYGIYYQDLLSHSLSTRLILFRSVNPFAPIRNSVRRIVQPRLEGFQTPVDTL